MIAPPTPSMLPPGVLRRAGSLPVLLGLLLTVALAPGAASAQVVLDRIGSSPGEIDLAPGDAILSWRDVASGARPEELVHWGALDVLTDLELADRPLILRLDNGGEVEVPAGAQLAGRPDGPADELARVEQALAAEDPVAAVERSFGGRPEWLAWSHLRLAEVFSDVGAWDEVAGSTGRAAELVDGELRAHLLTRRCAALMRSNAADEAMTACRRSLDAWTGLSRGLGRQQPLRLMGTIEGRRGRHEASRDFYRQSCEVVRRHAPGRQLEIDCLNNLGVAAGRRNDLAAAEQHFLQARALIEANGGDAQRVLANLGIVARLRGDYVRGETYARQSLALKREVGTPVDVAGQLVNLANVLFGGRKFEEAETVYAEAHRLHEVVEPGAADRFILLVNRSQNLLFGLRRIDEAERTLQQARSVLGETGSDLQVASIDAQLGWIELERGDHAAAVEILERARRAFDRLRPTSSYSVLAARASARAHAAAGDDERAEALFEEAIGQFERLQQRIGGGDRGLVAFRAKYQVIYRDYAEYLVDRGRPDEAFRIHERSRAGALLGLLRERDLDLGGDAGPAGILRRRDEKDEQIDAAYQRLIRVSGEEARQAVRAEIEALRAERDALTARAHAASPRLAAAESPPSLDTATIRGALAPGTIVLAYSAGPERSLVFALGRDLPVTARPVAATESELGRLVEEWTTHFEGSAASRERFRRSSERLGELLLEPVADVLAGAERVLLVPDGPLHGLSFAALPDPARRDHHLVERLTISRQVSASTQTVLGRSEPQPGARVAVVADPRYPEQQVAGDRRALGRLPASAAEARAIERIHGQRAQSFLGAAATEESARRALSEADIGHFAVHAVVDELLPLDSALVLGPDGEGGSGLLQAWEIAEQVEVRNRLVILSACETASGAYARSEGIVGLVRALQIGGARSVVASLGPVEDESTAILMEHLHRRLADGESPAAALRGAQLDLLRGPVAAERGGERIRLRLDDPRHWARFVLIGSPD